MVGVILLVCLVCGIYTSARMITRGADCIRSQLRPKDATKVMVLADDACEMDTAAVTSVHGWNQCCMDDLKSLFALYQSGALTKEEFEQVKRHLLSKMKAYA